MRRRRTIQQLAQKSAFHEIGGSAPDCRSLLEDYPPQDNEEDFQLVVKDRGIGISAVDQRRIFDKFYRSESAAVQDRPGHGLGLSLVRQVAELHHGDVSVNSVEGEGSTFGFSVSLPLAEVADEAPFRLPARIREIQTTQGEAFVVQ